MCDYNTWQESILLSLVFGRHPNLPIDIEMQPRNSAIAMIKTVEIDNGAALRKHHSK